MNQLFLIGNGFDLAHGLKTSYSDFIVWYLNKVFPIAIRDRSYKDDIISITQVSHGMNGYVCFADFVPFEDFTAFKKFKRANNKDFEFEYEGPFIKDIFNILKTFRWVDIESCYYKQLLLLYRQNLENNRLDETPFVTETLQKINKSFDALKAEFVEYISSINILEVETIPDIENHISNATKNLQRNEMAFFLVFNYTETLSKYLHLLEEGRYQVIYIHGKLGDENNPPIFGYGDEMDMYYEQLERLNSNEFLKNFKSFYYFGTTNYQTLMKQINSAYRIHIMGHSCGMSDRVLLNSIFDNDGCKSIQIYYFQKDQFTNDYFEKTQEISRHFKADRKAFLRNVIVPFPKSVPLVHIPLIPDTGTGPFRTLFSKKISV